MFALYVGLDATVKQGFGLQWTGKIRVGAKKGIGRGSSQSFGLA